MDVLITGASRGIGRAIAERLGRDGARVIVNWLQNEAAARETAAAVRAGGGEAILVQGDVRSVETLEKLVAVAREEFGGLDVLVQNAALGALKPMDNIRVAQWDLTLETSLRPFWLLTKLALPILRDGAHVVGITSLGSRQFTPGYAAMGASKAGVEALTRQLAVELAPRIRVNSVCGGPVDTDSFEYLPDSDRWRGDLERATPMKRLGTPTDIAGVVAMLCSPDAAWITGQTIVADGGLSCL